MKKLIPFLYLFFIINHLNAQDLEQIFKPLLSAKNISYTDHILQKDLFSDQLFRDTAIAYFDYSAEDTLIKVQTAKYETWRDPNKLVLIDKNDSTYRLKNANEFAGLIYNSFNERLQRFFKENPKSKFLLPQKDTIVNDVPYLYYKYVSLDSIEHGKRVYTGMVLLVDKKNQIPAYLRVEDEGFIDDSENHIVFFEEHWITNLKLDDVNFLDIADMRIPEHIKLEVPRKIIPLLEKGTDSPVLGFRNEDGKEVRLSDFHGNTVLLNITWVGCPHCMQSIPMLNMLKEQFTNKNLKIISLYPLDNKENVLKMNQNFAVNYGFFLNNENTKGNLDKFNINGYPTFYLIDKNGKIIKGWSGYSKKISNEILASIQSSIH